jgi:NAD-dependent SIR2 family protein deacetylase
MDELTRSNALLVVGSSVMVFSSYRFCRHAKALGKPVYIINRGHTRADAQADLKIEGDCNQVLPHLVRLLNPPA